MPADRKSIKKNYYEATKDARLLRNAISRILAGRRPWASTLKRFDLGERELNRIRSLDARFRTIMEDKHGVNLESLYKNKTPLPEIRLPDVKVIVLSRRPSLIIRKGWRRSRPKEPKNQ
jgi:hypothetical protein